MILTKQEKGRRNKKYKDSRPWVSHLTYARARCNYPKHDKYHLYGGRGIKCYLDTREIMILWSRDKAHLMKRPSLDRINHNGNYDYDNCRFIELRDNVLRGNGAGAKCARKTHCAKGHPLIWMPWGIRQCPPCRKEYEHKKYLRLIDEK